MASALGMEQFAAARLAYHEELERRVMGREECAVLYVVKALSFDRLPEPSAAAYLPTNRTICTALGKDPRSYEAAASRALRRLKDWDVLLTFPDAPGFVWINVQFGDWRAPRREEIAGWDGQRRPVDLPVMNTELRHLARCFMARLAGESNNRIFPALEYRAAVPISSTAGRTVDGPELGQPTGGGNNSMMSAAAPYEVLDAPTPDVNRPAFSFSKSGAAVSGHLEEKSSTLGAPGVSTRPPVLEKSSSTAFPRNVGAGFGVLEEKSSTPPNAARALSPPHTPPLKTFNVETFNGVSTGNGLRAAIEEVGKQRPPWMRPVRIRYQEEDFLMARIREAVGKADAEVSGGFWRVKIVRNFRGEILEEWAGDCISKIRTGFSFRSSPAAWLNNMLARAIGRKNLQGLPDGEPPVE